MRPDSQAKPAITAYMIRHAPHLSVILALLCLGAVLCFRYPQFLTTPGVRSHYPLEFFRGLIFYGMWAGGILAVLSLLFLPNKIPPLIALILIGVCEAYGGSKVYHPAEYDSFAVRMGLDIFMLDLVLVAILFIPLEAWFPLRSDQSLVRAEFGTDLIYFGVSHLGIQGIALLTSVPVERWMEGLAGGTALAKLPLPVQIIAGLIIADFVQYWVHRAFHGGFLWRFHRVHHSIAALDWLAGSRLHLVDIVVTRGLVFAVLFVCVSAAAIPFIALVIAFHAVWIHTNTRWSPRWVELVFVTPRIHHWHHAGHARAYDRNFAAQFSFIDRIFGTAFAPRGIWPDEYGVDGEVPEGYLRQMVWPFRK